MVRNPSFEIIIQRARQLGKQSHRPRDYGVGLWAAPAPVVLDHGAGLLCPFLAVVAALILESIPPAVTRLAGITLVAGGTVRVHLHQI
jgi:hypothetical protein